MEMLGRLRRSLTALCAVITGIILLVNGLFSLWMSEAQITERGDALFRSSVSTAVLRLSESSLIQWSWIMRTEKENQIAIHIEDNGEPFLYYGSWPSTGRQEMMEEVQRVAREQYGVSASSRPASVLEGSHVVFVFRGPDGNQYRGAVSVLRTPKGYRSVTVLGDTAEEQLAIRRQRWIYSGLILFSIFSLLGFSWWFSGRAVRPVAASQRRQAEFIAAASHELRTPLAVIGTSAAALRHIEGNQEREFVGAIERECTRTGKLVDDLLMLANADAQTWTMEVEPVELEQILQESVHAFQATAAQKRIDLKLQTPRRALPLIGGDTHRLGQLFSILLDNACRYTPEGGRVTVSAQAEGRYVQAAVADTGPGIAQEHLEKVFERFYREDLSRSKKEHYGLGLSIAKEIVGLHKGKIYLTQTPGGGLTVTVRIPML